MLDGAEEVVDVLNLVRQKGHRSFPRTPWRWRKPRARVLPWRRTQNKMRTLTEQSCPS
jgi:hypothetical protein